ncbi:uncharacterized protein DUF4397 [Mucilaginibacter gracilis]|uniref:Uncharacterized protein DUF4397 n=1 Tax=Mucilaginibacter gracilis TaxID=423350 RepID=A0A495J091_9SPHI|nr:DUF4397 domain-containing protein [Mucilaginibacter gracilis]RKR81714.1 uncharacterized protein DUF4397 [Mucilaginibacter gracilis]
MKKKSSIIAICVISLIAIIVGCGKAVIHYGDITLLDDNHATIKINNESMYANARTVFYKINDQRISGLLPARSPFPGGGYNTGGNSTADVLEVPSGAVKFSMVMPHKFDNGTDSVVLYSTTLQLTGNTSYTLHTADTAANTQSVLIKENLALADSGSARFHFVNLMPATPAVDIYYGASAATAADQSSDTLLVSNLQFMQNSPDVVLKIVGANRIWKVRAAGAAKTAAAVISSYTSTNVPASTRVYVGFAIGYVGKTTAAQKPYVSFMLLR